MGIRGPSLGISMLLQQKSLPDSRNSNTGQPDMVSWNPSLEHKTEFGPVAAEGNSGSGGSGYPDADYLDRVFAQLAHLGVISDEHDL